MWLTVNDALRWWSREMPNAEAIKVYDRSITFKQLWDSANQIAAGLHARGLRRGDRVSIVAMNSFEYCVMIFAVMRVGAIMAPLSFRLTRSEITDSFGDIEPKMVFTDAERRATVEPILPAGATLHALEDVFELRQADLSNLDDEAQAEDPVVIIATSGSTARPKGVVHTHRSELLYTMEYALMEPRCTRGSRILLLTPFSAASGYNLMLEFISLGVTIVMEPVFEPARALRLLVEEKITQFQGVPIFFERIAALPEFETADLSNIIFSQVGGAPVAPAMQAKWLTKGIVLRQLYGQTEAGGGWAARDDTALTEPIKAGHGGMFTRYAIMDAQGRMLPPGEEGEIVVRGPGIMKEYWRNPEATEAAFKGGWLHTGDVGVLDENGNLTFRHRMKDIIISGGLNISAAEVERVLRDLPGIEEVAVIAAPDEKFGETPLAVLHAPGAGLTETAVIAHCNANLANFKVPRYVVFLKEPLPKLHTGKIAKTVLREQYKDAERALTKVR